ncbi:MAG: hypothetical protein CM15mP74_09810 [Halieaceae bacterium]|nr:MAG: hypothetical protein CM15mP74_09810 [Halieaceae bacterium]
MQVPEANPAVAEWPLIGPAVYDLWQRAHEDLMSAARMIQPQLLSGGRILLGAAANTLLALILFFVALLIAGLMMANATAGANRSRQLLGTLADHERGDEIQTLVVATIRSVSNGVVGVAFLQALALGSAFWPWAFRQRACWRCSCSSSGSCNFPQRWSYSPLWPGYGWQAMVAPSAMRSARFICLRQAWQMVFSSRISWGVASIRLCPWC